MEKVIIIGAGGHAKSIADIVIKSGDILVGFLDDNINIGTKIINDFDIKVIGKIADIEKYKREEIKFIIGIGNNEIRKKISEKYSDLKYYTAIHPKSTIAIDTKIGIGTCVMANSVVNCSATIGKHSIINTGAIIEHDNIIEDFVHISPNVTIAGTVKICSGTHIGAGATIKNNIIIKENNIIGAGAVVVKDIEEQNKIYVGVPAKIKY